MLHTAAARVGALDLGFVPAAGGRDVAGILDGAEKGEIDFVYLLGADEIDTSRLGRAFVVYQGTHGDAGAHRADVVLPGAAYTEKSGLYVNSEGRVQLANRATFPPGEAKEDWAILRALSEVAGQAPSLRRHRRAAPRDHRRRAAFRDARRGAAISGRRSCHMERDRNRWHRGSQAPLESPIADFYLTNPIARASETMAECSRLFVQRTQMAAE